MTENGKRAILELYQYEDLLKEQYYAVDRLREIEMRLNAITRNPSESLVKTLEPSGEIKFVLVAVQYQPNPMAREELMIALLEQKEKIRLRQVEAERLCFSIEQRIETFVDEPGRTILRRRFILLNSFYKIGLCIGRSTDRVRKLYYEAAEAYGASFVAEA